MMSAFALLALLQQPEPPAALAIGYWLTTTGLVAALGGVALLYLGGAWTGRNPDDGSEVGWGQRRDAGLAGGLFGAFFLFGASLLVLAPLQLTGAVGEQRLDSRELGVLRMNGQLLPLPRRCAYCC